MSRDDIIGGSKPQISKARINRAAVPYAARTPGASGPDWLWTRWRARRAPWEDMVGLAQRCALRSRRGAAVMDARAMEEGAIKDREMAKDGAGANPGRRRSDISRRSDKARRGGGAALLALALMSSALLAGPAHAACQPPSYCNQPGACLNIQSIKSQAAQKYGGAGYRVASVRLRPHGRTATCLLYEVTLQHPSRGARVVYWDIKGGEIAG